MRWALADSLQILDTVNSATDRYYYDSLVAAIVRDAHRLVAQCLHDNDGRFSLRDIYLLAHVCDTTHDPAIQQILTLALETAAPAFCDELVAAQQRATQQQIPLLRTYHAMAVERDNRSDRLTDVAQLELIISLRDKTPEPYRNTEWEARVAESDH